MEGSEERQVEAAQGMRTEVRDHALVRLDEQEVKARMQLAFDRFIGMGFEVHLVAVEMRGATEYRLILAEDGAEDVPLRRIQSIADEFRLDIFVEKGQGLVMYARWSPQE